MDIFSTHTVQEVNTQKDRKKEIKPNMVFMWRVRSLDALAAK